MLQAGNILEKLPSLFEPKCGCACRTLAICWLKKVCQMVPAAVHANQEIDTTNQLSLYSIIFLKEIVFLLEYKNIKH